MSDEIPLVKDILGVYPDAKINDHLNTDMIKMYNEFINVSNTTNVVNVAISNNYTNVQIYDYIKFINMTCLGTECYKHVIPYITEDNIDTFTNLFDNYDILSELLPLLPYEIAIRVKQFNDPNFKRVKELWTQNNMTFIKRFKSDLLDCHMILETDFDKYFLINNVIYSNHRKIDKNISESFIVLADLEYAAKNGCLPVIKYIFDIFYKILGDSLFTTEFKVTPKFNITFYRALHEACKENHLNIVSYMISFLKSKDKLFILHDYIQGKFSWVSSFIDNINIVKYLIDENIIKYYFEPDNIININKGLLIVSRYGNIEMIDFLLEKGGDINCEISISYDDHISNELTYYYIKDTVNLLSISSYYGRYDTVVYLIDKGIDIVKYGYKSIMYASQSNNVNIMTYIIDRLANISNTTKGREMLMNTVFKCGNFEVLTYVKSKYYSIEYIIDNFTNIDSLLISAFASGCVKFIEDMMNNANIRNISNIINSHQINSKMLVPIIKNNSEECCIKFMNLMIGHFESVIPISKIIRESILKGYLDLAIILYDSYKFTKNNQWELLLEDVENSVSHSQSEETCIKFIKRMYEGIEIDDEHVLKIVEASICKKYMNLIAYVLKDRKIDLPINDLLVKSIRQNNVEMVKYLIEKGPKIDITRLMVIDSKSFEIYKILIENGVDVREVLSNATSCMYGKKDDEYINTIIYIYDRDLVSLNNIITYRLFNHACTYNVVKVVEYLLKKGFFMKKYINKFLKTSVMFNHIDVVNLLVKNEKDVEFIRTDSELLIYACKYNYLDIVKVLAEYISVYVNGGEALLYACKNEYFEIIVFLSALGIHPITNNKILRMSAKYGYIDIVKFLIEMDADLNVISNKYYHEDVDVYLKSIGVNLQYSAESMNDNNYSSDELDSGSDSDSYSDSYSDIE